MVDFLCVISCIFSGEAVDNIKQETLLNTVKKYRVAKGLSQGELADCVRVTRQTIISLEKGNYVPSLLLAMNLSEVLEAPIVELFFKEEKECEK